MSKHIRLCLAKMSDTGDEQRFIYEAFGINWVGTGGTECGCLLGGLVGCVINSLSIFKLLKPDAKNRCQ